MTQTSYPYGVVAPMYEAEWQEFFYRAIPDGVYRDGGLELAPFADATGKQVKVRTGSAFVHGHLFLNDATVTLAVNDNVSGSPRLDRIVLRSDLAADSTVLAIHQGVGGAGLPALTQTSTVWEVPLGYVTLPSGFTGVNAGDVTDQRQFSSAPYREETLYFNFTDILGAGQNSGTWKARWPFRILAVQPITKKGGAPAGGSAIFDVNKNDVTIFTTQANRPTIAAGSTDGAEVTNMDVTTGVKGDRIEVDCDVVPATPPSNVIVMVTVVRTGP